MARGGMVVRTEWIKKVFEKSLKKRYGIDLETFLGAIANDATKMYPGCEDLVELTKYL